MKNNIIISVIIPIYNGEAHIDRCFDSIMKQNFSKPWELIIVDDASTDNTKEIIKKYNISNLKLYSLSNNSGPSIARNLGISKALGEYIYMLDVDDLVSIKSLNTLYTSAKKYNCDFVFSDFKRIQFLKNQREGTFNYPTELLFNENEITKAMIKELHDPTLGHLGLIGCNGRLIKRSIITDNNILFDEKLRLLEDKTFGWNVLSFSHNVLYIREQLYSYYVYPNINTAMTESLNYGFTFDTVKLILSHINNSLKRRNLSKNEIEKYNQQALIFFIIHILITITRPMFQGKINFSKGKKIRKDIIEDVFRDNNVSIAIKNYKSSINESWLIPKAIAWKSLLLLEFACNKRAKDTIVMRRLGVV